MRLAALIAFGLLWFCNFIVLKRFYDVTDYEQFKAFWKARGILYDGMFFVISLILFRSWKGLERAIACFMVIITAGSFIDKAFFMTADYMYADIVLIVLAIIASGTVYGRDKRGTKELVN